MSNNSHPEEKVLSTLSNRQRFLRACRSEPLDYPPIWMMRQAGRSLPEYRAVKEKHSFVEIVQTPELATEVTLQPIRRFEFDAAILFSDILVISEAMGQPYGFADRGGIEMDFKIAASADVDRLDPDNVREKLNYVAEALPMIREDLGERAALIGFCGAPWTLANYMMEGGSAREFVAAKNLYYSEPEVFSRLMEKITSAVSEYLLMQIDAGVDALQIFDTQGGALSPAAFAEASGNWISRIISSIREKGHNTPVIVFSKGAAQANRKALDSSGADILSLDWTVDMAKFRRKLPDQIGVQGNLDPIFLQTSIEAAACETKRILKSMEVLDGHIFNLGHGVAPDSKIPNIETVVETVRNFSPER